MRVRLTEHLQCPACGGTLSATVAATAEGEEIWRGTLNCAACDQSYPVEKGMPQLYVNDASWAPKAREAAGWVAIHKQDGIYEPGPDAVDLQIPYYPEEPWIKVARGFDAALAELQLTGRERVLDLGAGRGWAAKQFARLGCETVALDVVADDNVGLGRGRALMQSAGVYFDRLIADGENLPFRPATFDLVFCAATLHHASDLPLFFQQIARVLKPDGRLCAINEPSISLLEDEAAVLARDAGVELELGINETRPNITGYVDALDAAGLLPDLLVPAVYHAADDATMRAAAQDLGGILGRPARREPKRTVWRLYNFMRNRARLWQRGRRTWPDAPPSADARARSAYRILLVSDQELFLVARRPKDRVL